MGMKTLATIVTERGQVSIPTQVRKQLHLSCGQRVAWEVISDHECKVVVVAESHVPGAEAMLGYAAKFRSPRRTREWLTELREGEDA
jgi:bifunctional DNA-binding transcriptional regulator/antitoxin component of YhaV-PrlF toxin-antitoxin module